MPRKHTDLDRAEKRSDIVSAATALFADDGYDDTTMGKIAATAGVTANTIYWYFKDKDDSLVGVLDEVHARTLTRFGALDREPLGNRILWVVAELAHYHRLIDTVHARAALSPQIARWHNDFHSKWEGWLAAELHHSGMPTPDVPTMTRVIVWVVEGMLTHQRPDTENRTTLAVLLSMTNRPPA
jgi:AcrR family transcriptional regulator